MANRRKTRPAATPGNIWERPEANVQVSGPLFPLDHNLHLREVELSGFSFGPFVAGRVLAELHRGGLFHGDFNRGNFNFDYRTGKIHIFDLATVREAALDPETMAADLVPAFLTFEREWFRSFLAGYCKASFISLDNVYPDYTDTLLGYIGGDPVSLPRPRPPVVNLEEILSCPHVVLDTSGARYSWKCKDRSTRNSLWQAYGRELALVGLASLLCGVDVAEFVPDDDTAQTAESPRVVTALLRTMVRHGRRKADDAAVIPEIEIVNRLLERLTTGAAGSPPESSSGSVDIVLLNNLATVFQNVQRQWLPPFADAMIDTADWLAAKSDSSWNVQSDYRSRLTVSAAQLSYLFLQYTLHDVGADELRLAAILRDHARLSWMPRLVMDTQDGDELLRCFSYAQSACMTWLRLFEFSLRIAEEDGSNPLWSLLPDLLRTTWASLKRLLHYALDPANDVSGPAHSNVDRAITLAANTYAHVLRMQASALLTADIQISLAAADSVKDVLELSKWVEELAGFLRSHSAFSAEGRARLSAALRTRSERYDWAE